MWKKSTRIAWKRPARASSSILPRYLHFRVRDAALLDHYRAVELDGAIAHRHVVVPARVPLAAALRVRSGGKQEIPGERARGGAVPLGRIAVQRDAVPQRLRVHPPAQMRDGERIAVLLGRPAVLQPVAHQLGIDATVDLRDMAFA